MSNNKPTDAELEILNVLWENGPSTVKDINEILSEKKDVGYTTTLKIMQIMHKKGYLGRVKNGRNHIYEAKKNIESTRQLLLDKLLSTAYGGSAKKLVLQALGSHEASIEELEEIKQFIEKIKDEDATGNNK